MVVDSSAIVAIFCLEPGYAQLERKLQLADSIAIPAPIVLETAFVLSRKMKCDGLALLVPFLESAEADVMPFGRECLLTAFRAFERYGKDRHPAALNFGDCMSYAAAKLLNEPLLFVGNDFSQTDITAA